MTLISIYDLTFSLMQAVVMTYSHAEVKVSDQSVQKIDWKQMDGVICIT